MRRRLSSRPGTGEALPQRSGGGVAPFLKTGQLLDLFSQAT